MKTNNRIQKTETKKQRRKNLIEFLFVATICIGGIIYFQNGTDKIEKRILNEGKFAIGTFIKHEYPMGRAYSNKYRYSFNDEYGKTYYRGDTRNISKGDWDFRLSVFEGDKFLVLYNEDGSMIYFDHPIKDSTDFKRYIREFEEMRKK